MLSIIVAIAHNGVIGCHNKLLWHITEDMKYFRRVTTGHPVIMGRKTFESIGRPLPGRQNIIITRNRNYEAPGCIVTGSIEEALSNIAPTEEAFVIGGGEIYAQALPLCDKLYITEVDASYQGDTFFPAIDKTQWVLEHEEHFLRGESFEKPFSFLVYNRKHELP